MRKLVGFFSILVSGVIDVALLDSPALATPITYTETATASGYLGGVAFTNESIVLTMHNDTTNVIGVPTNPFNVGRVTVQVGTGTPVAFTALVNAFSYHPETIVGFSDHDGGDILDVASTALATYDLKTSIGPITGIAISDTNSTFLITGGDFVLTSVSNATFTATTSAVPESASLTLLGTALAGLILIRGRRKSDGKPQPSSGLYNY